MKIIFICFNYLTLYKAINYIKYIYSDCECIIIFRTSVADVPSGIKHYFRLVEIIIDRKKSAYKIFSKYNNLIKILLVIKRTINVIRKEIDESKQMNLVVFKDHEIMESTFIEKFRLFTRKNGKVILIEEGNALYEKRIPRKRLGYCWYIIQKLFGLSDYFLNNYPQGYNLLVNEIVCSDAERFTQLKNRVNLKIVEQNNYFTFENCQFFIENILGYNFEGLKRYKSFDFAFLTQPLEEIGLTEDMEEKIIERLLITGKNVLIKKHPRDMEKRRYSDGCNVHELPEELNVIPFECLYGIIGEPIIVTFYSSAYKNMLLDNKDTRVILLYKLLNNERINSLMDDLEKEFDRRIFIPESIEQLDDAINWWRKLQV
ncbi:polysialyltransferase family glycosyltransferase [Pelotomaculum propionicicum]|uniref:polysialyltransferase family glycosyltransferase n=1 Tax=Pelotomaculum propionicicum TaxID=258475 RepID=UPI003B7F3D82